MTRQRKRNDIVHQAQQYARVGNIEQTRRAIKRARAIYDLSAIQWHNLQLIIGRAAVESMRGHHL